MVSCGLICIVFLTVPKLQFGDFLTALVHRGAAFFRNFYYHLSCERWQSAQSLSVWVQLGLGFFLSVSLYNPTLLQQFCTTQARETLRHRRHCTRGAAKTSLLCSHEIHSDILQYEKPFLVILMFRWICHHWNLEEKAGISQQPHIFPLRKPVGWD